MRKIFYFVGLLIVASIVFSGCRRDDVPEPPVSGVGDPTPTTDPGVVIHGIRWATRNVGAFGTFVENIEDAGMFYQWNRRRAWNTTDETVSGWDNSIPTGTTWERANDPCPQGWRVPTHWEQSSLHWGVRTTQNGVNGFLFGTAPNQIFLPVVGRRGNADGRLIIDTDNVTGSYWSSTQWNVATTTAYRNAHFLWLGVHHTEAHMVSNRANGFSIRCVENVSIPVTEVTLNKTATTLMVGFTETLTATIAPTNATNQTITWRSNNPAIASVNIQGDVTAVSTGTATITATTACGRSASSTITVTQNTLSSSLDGVVINGIRWATRNVDAPGTFAESPIDAGMLYQWNRRVGWTREDAWSMFVSSIVGWDTPIPTGTEWEQENNPCPTGWRVPTDRELRLLIDSGVTSIRYRNTNGFIFGIAPNQIFLPISNMPSSGGGASYWSSTRVGTERANSMRFSTLPYIRSEARTFGFSIRCVAGN